MINGQRYYETEATGMEVLAIAANNGCDSILHIQLDFLQPISERLTLNLCIGESQTINGTIYDANNLSGQEIFLAGAQSGCDSMIDVQVNMLNPAIGQFSESLCEGEFLALNGVIYDATNPIGMERFEGAAANGCDSAPISELKL